MGEASLHALFTQAYDLINLERAQIPFEHIVLMHKLRDELKRREEELVRRFETQWHLPYAFMGRHKDPAMRSQLQVSRPPPLSLSFSLSLFLSLALSIAPTSEGDQQQRHRSHRMMQNTCRLTHSSSSSLSLVCVCVCVCVCLCVCVCVCVFRVR